MTRPRSIPDADIFAAILHVMTTDGEKSVAFSTIARMTGLAAPSLVQRYGGLQTMVRSALLWEWDRLDALAKTAIAELTAADKSPQALLKALTPGPTAALLAASRRSAALRDRATLWRSNVEQALAAKLGTAAAALLFAAWQGQALWQTNADKGFKLKDAIKRLG